MGGIVLSPTQIILFVASKYFDHHKTNSSTPKKSGMHPHFTNPIALRCLEDISSTGMSEYRLYSLDQ